MSRFRFGRSSERRLRTVQADIQRVLRRALAWGVIDFTVVEGHRGQTRQDAAFAAGKSQVRWPDGRHNLFPSEGVDVAPWVAGEIPWDDHRQWYILAGVIAAAAKAENVELRFGYDWDGDTELDDQDFHDLGHVERPRNKETP